MLAIFRGLACFVICFALATQSWAQSRVWIVDGDGGADFLDIQSAVNAASDGDTILVRPRLSAPTAPYADFDVVNKALHITSVQGMTARIQSVRLDSLSAGKLFALSNLEILGSYVVSRPPVSLLNCQGSVHVTSSDWSQDMFLQVGLYLLNCDDVTIVNCSITSGYGFTGSATAVDALASNIAIYDSSITGSEGFFETHSPNGGTGLHLRSFSTALLQQTTVHGGTGADSCSSSPGAGGHGTILEVGSVVKAIQSTTHGGIGGVGLGLLGLPFCGNNNVGSSGQALVLLGGSWEDWPLTRRQLTHPRSVHGAGLVDLQVRAVGGDRIWLAEGTSGDFALSPTAGGVRHLPGGYPGTPFGVLPGNGSTTIPFHLPEPSGGAESQRKLLQLNVVDLAGRRWFGSPFLVETLATGIDTFCTGPFYVSAQAAPGGNGTSWATAFADLQEALVAAADRLALCEASTLEVWVAEGTYTPGIPGSSRTVRFDVQPGMALLGGFAGTESFAYERDPAAHPTILSGDLAGDDLPGFLNRSDNAHRVVQMMNTPTTHPPAILDVFTIRGGHADGNSTSLQSGAGVDGLGGQLRNCRVIDNYAELRGGGLQLADPNFRVVSSEIRGNRAGESGGGIYLIRGAHIINSRIAENEVIAANGRGGGIHYDLAAMMLGSLTGLIFEENRAAEGAAIYYDAPPLAHMWASNLTVVRNQATLEGGGILLAQGRIVLTNSILWENERGGVTDESAQIFVAPGATIEALRCCVMGLVSYLGSNNMGVDPLLDANLELLAGSPCIDAADRSLVGFDLADLNANGVTNERIPFDLLGHPRFVDDPAAPDRGVGPQPHADLGALERQVP